VVSACGEMLNADRATVVGAGLMPQKCNRKCAKRTSYTLVPFRQIRSIR
jgi:hypothetical protein